MTGAEQMIEQLVMWRRKKFCLFPEDVINMMIDHGLCTEEEVKQIIESTNKKELDIRLPTVYIAN